MITMNSSQKSYAQSTLNRKYKGIGLAADTLEELHQLLAGCSNFYKIIDTDNAFRAVDKACRGLVNREQFDAVLSLDARNDDMEYYVYPESYFYEDGSDDIFLLIAPELLVGENADFSEADSRKLTQFLENGGDLEAYDGTLPFCDDDEKFDILYSQKVSKKQYYYPADLACYADLSYFKKTTQTEALQSFLIELGYDEVDAQDAISDMIDLLTDCGMPDLDGPGLAMQLLADDGVTLSKKQLETFLALVMELNNNTRMPSNNGFTPNELGEAMPIPAARPTVPADERTQKTRKAILDLLDMPDDIKSQILSDSNRNGVPVGKVGRNDPCPCGSGKKYKKCCGK